MKVCMVSIADIHQPYGSTSRPYFLGKYLARHGVELAPNLILPCYEHRLQMSNSPLDRLIIPSKDDELVSCNNLPCTCN